jgi:glutathione S-transferase
MNIKGRFPGFKVWAGAAADVERVVLIWRECLAESKGPYLFGKKPGMADAMYAPVCTRFLTYDVALDAVCAAYCRTMMALPYMQEWVEAAKAEHEEVLELDVEF